MIIIFRFNEVLLNKFGFYEKIFSGVENCFFVCLGANDDIDGDESIRREDSNSASG